MRIATATDVVGAPAPHPIDWSLAERFARRVAGRDAFSTCYLSGSLVSDFADVTVEAEGLVAEMTGLRSPQPARAGVLDRSGWVTANVASMRRLLEPFLAHSAERLAGSPMAPVGRRVSATELGALLGYMSRRVLGQYDLLVPSEENDHGDLVHYVGLNVLGLEKRYAFRPRDFRLWIAIHEVTHRAQFMGVPWMQSYFLSLIEQSLALMGPDPTRRSRVLRRSIEELRQGRNPLDDHGLVGLLATPEQREVLDRVQALMSLLEGHGNAVMNRLGAVHVAGQERMALVLMARRDVGGLAGQLQKLFGIELKMRQYAVGEAFVDGVVREGGFGSIDLAWRSPECLPTLRELEDPRAWLSRMEGPVKPVS